MTEQRVQRRLAAILAADVVGYSALGVSYKPPIAYSITTAVLTYALSLVSVYVASLVINTLAPNFGGCRTTAVSMPGSLTSCVNIAEPFDFDFESVRAACFPM